MPAPNQLGEDPDIESRVLAFSPDASDRRTGLGAALAKRQGFCFLPLLLFDDWSLHVASIRTLTTPPGMKQRWPELAFRAVQVAVFGFVLGGAFSPNHIGMPTVPHSADIDFLRRQVLMSRNVRGGFLVHFFMGGLEYQIEHHLFPSAPAPTSPRSAESSATTARRTT